MFKESIFLVTGGASGLGRATVELLYNEGANLVICDLKQIDFIKDEQRVLNFQVDVTSEKDIESIIGVVKHKFGKLSGIINCAGIAAAEPVYDASTGQPHSLQVFQNVLEVNVVGTFNVIRLAVPLMVSNVPNKDGERGVIINTSSVVAKHPVETLVSYISSKGAISSMTGALAKELSQWGIRVVDIAPGLFDTPLLNKSGAKNMKRYLFPARSGHPNEYANIVKTIIKNPYLNGTCIELDAAGFR